MTIFAHSVGFGIVTASIIALAAIAFSLQFSVTTTPNFAHGELLTAGAYGAYVMQKVSANLLLDALGAVLFGGAVAMILNLAVIRPYRRISSKRLTLFLVTVAASWIMQNILLLIFGAAPTIYRLPTSSLHSVGPFLWTTIDEEIIISAVVILALLHALLRYTKLGKSLRAVSDNPELARVTGIRYPLVLNVTWAMDGALAGFAGFVLALNIGALTPSLGFNFLVVVFAAAVIGGLGHPYGTLVGALVIGLAMGISSAYLPGQYSESIAFILLIGALLVRPRGIFSAAEWNMAE